MPEWHILLRGSNAWQVHLWERHKGAGGDGAGDVVLPHEAVVVRSQHVVCEGRLRQVDRPASINKELRPHAATSSIQLYIAAIAS